jgi:FkbM family methyltransferase
MLTHWESLRSLIPKAQAQLNQDLFALLTLGFPKSGFFVEVGGADGLTMSNTHLLEKSFGWRGIIAEPAVIWHEQLLENRECIVDKRAVWGVSGQELLFNQTTSAALSTIDSFTDADSHSLSREDGFRYMVQTVSLYDLLEQNNAPKIIDYLSVDTEGSEYEILKNFDFESYSFRVITVEHNHTDNRDLVKGLLTSNGYRRVHEAISDFDDWYILSRQ